MKSLTAYIGAGLLILLAACAPSRFVEPLDKGETAITGELGGPIFTNLGAPLPVPLGSAVVGHGFTENITGYGGIHFTSLGFGVVQTEFGAAFNLLDPDSSMAGLSGSITANTAFDVHEGNFRLWPQVDINLRWPIGPDKNIFYAGASNWFEPRNTAYLSEPQKNKLIPAIQTGYIWRGEQWDVGLEAKWIAVGFDNSELAVDYVGVGQTGSFGLYLSLTRKWKPNENQ